MKAARTGIGLQLCHNTCCTISLTSVTKDSAVRNELMVVTIGGMKKRELAVPKELKQGFMWDIKQKKLHEDRNNSSGGKNTAAMIVKPIAIAYAVVNKQRVTAASLK